VSTDRDLGDLDQFTMRAGVVSSGKLGDEARGAVFRDAVAFRRAGGVISTSDWYLMSDTTKEIYVEAGELVVAERIAVLAAMMGAKLPGKRRNPTAPENIDEYKARLAEEAEDEEESAAISAFLDEVTA